MTEKEKLDIAVKFAVGVLAAGSATGSWDGSISELTDDCFRYADAFAKKYDTRIAAIAETEKVDRAIYGAPQQHEYSLVEGY